MATIHLICGPTAAGKTSYSLELARELGCVRFAIDEWMANLFSRDTGNHLGVDWVRERAERCERQIWCVCRQLLKLGQDVVLDLGFPKKRHRDKFHHLALSASSAIQLHYVQADPEVRKARILQRNAGNSDPSVLQMTEDLCEGMEGAFEAPEGEELDEAVMISTDH